MQVQPWLIIRRFLIGSCMGVAGLIPGVSSGTIAVIAGAYQELIETFNLITTKKRSLQHFFILGQVGSGMVAATFLFAQVIESLIALFPYQVNFFLIGLIAGTVPSLGQYAFTGRLRLSDLVFVGMTMAGVVYLGLANPPAAEPLAVLTGSAAVLVFLAGFLAGGAGLIPGVSGSTVLLMIGMYTTMISAIRGFQLPFLLILAAGAFLGFLVFTRGIHYLLTQYRRATYQAMTGLILGAAFLLWPGQVAFSSQAAGQMIFLLPGALLTYLAYYWTKKNPA